MRPLAEIMADFTRAAHALRTAQERRAALVGQFDSLICELDARVQDLGQELEKAERLNKRQTKGTDQPARLARRDLL